MSDIDLERKLAYKRIKYKRGMKYQLEQDYMLRVPILEYSIETKYFELTPEGILLVRDGYAWDGPSGPTVDIKSFMRGSMVHDVIYQMLRMEVIDKSNKEVGDQLLYDICVEDGMWNWVAWAVQKAVTRFGFMSTHPDKLKREYTAP